MRSWTLPSGPTNLRGAGFAKRSGPDCTSFFSASSFSFPFSFKPSVNGLGLKSPSLGGAETLASELFSLGAGTDGPAEIGEVGDAWLRGGVGIFMTGTVESGEMAEDSDDGGGGGDLEMFKGSGTEPSVLRSKVGL